MTDLRAIELQRIDGAASSLADYAGKVLLVVNVASKCGLTPQYEGLESLYRRYRERGLVVLGFPANDFRGQEPGSDAEIADFCRLTYEVDFPMFSKIRVTGEDKHPLFAALIEAHPKISAGDAGGMRQRLQGHGIEPNPEPELVWNFEKFLIGRDGNVVGRFPPDMAPDDARLVAAIEQALAA
jgi:glutathione peroxidase